MNFFCNQEIAQDLLLNWAYDKRELATELGIQVPLLDSILSGQKVNKKESSLSSRLIKISRRYKQQNNIQNIHTAHSKKSIIKKADKKKIKENE